jgi:hypothetical protein
VALLAILFEERAKCAGESRRRGGVPVRRISIRLRGRLCSQRLCRDGQSQQDQD